MKRAIAILVAISILFTQCTVPKNTVTLLKTKQPVVREDISFSYSADQIANRENNLKTGWAKRNNIQVLEVNIVNNTDKSIHGTQFSFVSNGKVLEIANNKLAAEKLKSRKFPKYVVFIPVFLIIAIVAGALEGDSRDLDGDGFDDDPNDFFGKKKANTDETKDYNLLQKGLYTFNISQKTLKPGEQLSGLIALKSKKSIEELDIQIRPVDFEVVGQ